MSSTHDDEAPQKLLRVVVYTTLSRALGVQGIYRASISNICSAVAGTAYVVCAEPFILWLQVVTIGVQESELTAGYIYTYKTFLRSSIFLMVRMIGKSEQSVIMNWYIHFPR